MYRRKVVVGYMAHISWIRNLFVKKDKQIETANNSLLELDNLKNTGEKDTEKLLQIKQSKEDYDNAKSISEKLLSMDKYSYLGKQLKEILQNNNPMLFKKSILIEFISNAAAVINKEKSIFMNISSRISQIEKEMKEIEDVQKLSKIVSNCVNKIDILTQELQYVKEKSNYISNIKHIENFINQYHFCVDVIAEIYDAFSFTDKKLYIVTNDKKIEDKVNYYLREYQRLFEYLNKTTIEADLIINKNEMSVEECLEFKKNLLLVSESIIIVNSICKTFMIEFIPVVKQLETVRAEKYKELEKEYLENQVKAVTFKKEYTEFIKALSKLG